MKKNIKFTLKLVASFMLFYSLSAKASLMNTSDNNLLNDLKNETGRCALMLVTKSKGYENIVGFNSICPSLILNSDFSAQVYINNQWLKATIITSEDADSYDLNHLYITDYNGDVVASRLNVPAFNSVVLALTGGEFIFLKKVVNP